MNGQEILVFVDPTPRGDVALALARAILPRLASRIVLLATEADAAEAPGLLERALGRLAVELPGTGIETRTRAGRPREAIAAEAAGHAYDLVIVPPAGRRTVGRWLHGSRILDAIRRVRAPVLVARRMPGRIEKILVAAAGTPFTEGTVAAAADFAKAVGAGLRGVHVVDRVLLPFPDHPEAGDAPDDPLSLQDPDVVREVGRARAILAERGFDPAIEVRAGLIVEEVLDALEEGGYDLLFVGAHLAEEAEGGRERENFTERFALEASVPVLIHRPKPAAA